MLRTPAARVRRLACATAVAALPVSACQPAAQPAATATPEATAPAEATARRGPTATAEARSHAITAVPTPTALAPSGPFDTDVVTLHNGGRTVPVAVYVADVPDLRARGLMHREHLADGTGMLFTYDTDATGRFWMRDTLIPLSIAFFDAAGDVIALLDMEPCTTPVCPRYGPDRPYRYALEVPQGWFDEQGVGLGWRLDVAE